MKAILVASAVLSLALCLCSYGTEEDPGEASTFPLTTYVAFEKGKNGEVYARCCTINDGKSLVVVGIPAGFSWKSDNFGSGGYQQGEPMGPLFRRLLPRPDEMRKAHVVSCGYLMDFHFLIPKDNLFIESTTPLEPAKLSEEERKLVKDGEKRGETVEFWLASEIEFRITLPMILVDRASGEFIEADASLVATIPADKVWGESHLLKLDRISKLSSGAEAQNSDSPTVADSERCNSGMHQGGRRARGLRAGCHAGGVR